jgi:integrase
MRMLGGDYVFPGAIDGKPLSHAALSVALHRVDRSDLTVHGFRSTFRDWAAEQTNFPREIAEKALAHRVGDETERSYQRGDLLAKRRKLIEAWARYCDSPAPVGKVVPLRHSGST